MDKNFKNYNNSDVKTEIEMNLQNRVVELEKKISSLDILLEIMTYTNKQIRNDNLVGFVNDMLIGCLGATKSSVYIFENNELKVGASNCPNSGTETCYMYNYVKQNNMNSYMIGNCDNTCKKCKKCTVMSSMGLPIELENRLLGYIVIEHSIENYFTKDHFVFVNAITKQLAITFENSFLYNKLKNMANKDTLIDIFNRRHFFELVEKKMSENSNSKFAIAMIDFDKFKSINDTLGHQFGDEVLKQSALRIKNNISEFDIVARYGGEEIIVWVDLENTNDLKLVFENIRLIIQNTPVIKDEMSYNVTVSIGISTYMGNTDSLSDVIKRADENLYKAKNNGRNCVVMD